MKNNLYRIFLIAFLCLFGSLFGYIAITNFNGVVLLISILFLILGLGLIYLLDKFNLGERIDARILVFIAILLILPLQLYLGKRLEVAPTWDFGYVYKAAASIVEHGKIYDPKFSYYGLDFNSYFESCPNNLGILVLFTLYFKVLSIFREPSVYCGIVLNIVFIDFALVLFTFFLRKVFSNKKALIGIVVWLLFLPFWLYIPIFYTDTITLPVMMGSIYLLHEQLNAESRVRQIVLGLLTGVMLCIGMLLKTSVAILLVGILLYIVFLHKPKRAAMSCAFVLVGFIAIYGSFQVWTKHTSIVDMSDVDNLKKPYTHYLMMGLENVGGWNSKDTTLTMSIYGAKEKKDANMELIKSRLTNYGATGYVKFLYKKAAWTWGDGTYYSYSKLNRQPLRNTRLHDYVVKDGKYYSQFEQFCNGLQMLLLFLMLVSMVNCFIKKEIDTMFLLHVTIFGIFIFLLLWETRSRYLLNFVPFMLILGIDGLNSVYRLLQKSSRRLCTTDK